MSETRVLSMQQGVALLEKVIIGGDLAQLSPAERVMYYNERCQAAGLEPLSRPFEYIVLNGKLTLYANKECAAQLRDKRKISLGKPDIVFADDVVTIAIDAHTTDGRTDSDIGIVSIAQLKGDAKCNAIMKAMTKAKRRVTLSISGLGILDESEIETVPDAQRVQVDMATGEMEPGLKSASTFTTYIKDATALGRFWAWCTSLGLNEEAVHVALGVKHLAEFPGTVVQARNCVQAYVKANASPHDPVPPDESLPY